MWLCWSWGVRFDPPMCTNSCFYSLFHWLTGPSNQVNIGPDRVVFNNTVTITANGPTEQTVTVSVLIQNDVIALEDDELVTVDLTIVSPPSGVNPGDFITTFVTIVDDDCKFSIVRQGLFCLECIKVCVCLGCLALRAYFTEPEVVVEEDDGMVEICVQKNLETIQDVVFGLQSRNGSATGNRMQYTTKATLN